MPNARSKGAGRAIAAALALAAAPPAAALQVPKGTEVIDVDFVPGKFGTVHFEHAKHNDAFTRPDGSPVRCKDCHHKLARDEPTSANEDMKCTGCHARYGDPPKIVAGELAPVLASLRPDGAIEYRSILFHEWCWACHRRTMRAGHRNDRCRFCHERGVASDTMHGRFDAIHAPGTGLSWMRCSAGTRWNGKGCDGAPRFVPWNAAPASCPEGYRLPTRAELQALLGPAAPGARGGACRTSDACATVFGAEAGPFWTSDAQGDYGFTVSVADGATALAAPIATAAVRCVRPEP